MPSRPSSSKAETRAAGAELSLSPDSLIAPGLSGISGETRLRPMPDAREKVRVIDLTVPSTTCAGVHAYLSEEVRASKRG